MDNAIHRHRHDLDNLSGAVAFRRDPNCHRTDRVISAVLAMFAVCTPFPTSLGDKEGSMKSVMRPERSHEDRSEVER
jgi:hypothetical protein